MYERTSARAFAYVCVLKTYVYIKKYVYLYLYASVFQEKYVCSMYVCM